MATPNRSVDPRQPALDVQDPYPCYEWLRAHEPVAWCNDANGWLVSKYDDVVAVLKDFETFRQIPYFDGPQRFVFDLDEPRHRPARRVYTAGASFAGGSIAERIGPEMASIAREAVWSLPANGFDGQKDFVSPAVAQMVGRLFDLPDPAESRVDWSESLTGPYPEPSSTRGAEELKFAEDLIAARRERPGADPFSHIIRANEVADEVSEEELAWEIWDLIFAGGHSTVDQAGLAMHALAADRQKLTPASRFSEEAGRRRAVEELLRYTPHVHYLRRVVTEETELEGVKLLKGQTVYVLLASANRDETRWSDPDTLDLDREGSQRIVTFGTGIHTTPAGTFMRMTLGVLLREFFRRYERVSLAAPAQYRNVIHDGLLSLACPASLPFAV